MDFAKQFKAARRVSTPLVAIRTFDAKSATGAVIATLPDNGAAIPLIMWDCKHGYRGLNDAGLEEMATLLNGIDADATADINIALTCAEFARQDVILFFSMAHLLLNDQNEKRAILQGFWNLRDGYKANGNMAVLLCSPGCVLPSELVNDILVTDEPLPVAAELVAIVRGLYRDAKAPGPDAETLTRAVDALIGLPVFAAEQATAMCLDASTGKLDTAELWERKRQVIAQTPGCSVYASKATLHNVRGLKSVVSFLCKRLEGKNPPALILFQDEVEKAFAGTGTDLSGVKTELTGSYCTWFENSGAEGVTFIGLPGVSKSELAKAIANEYGKPLIGFDIAAMQSGIIGSSGENLRAAQKMVSAMSGDRPILVISTCNGIDSVPPEIKRRIGSLGIFFFDEPTTEERADILTLYRETYGIAATDPAPDMNGWTGAEIKECCRKADIFGMSLKESAGYVVPVTKSSRERITALRMNSSGKYLSASKSGVYTYADGQSQAAMPIIADGRKMREVN